MLLQNTDMLKLYICWGSFFNFMLSLRATQSKGPQVGIKTGPLLRTQPQYLDCTLRWATRVPWFWSFDVICWQWEEIRISPDTSHLNHPYTHPWLQNIQFQPHIIIIFIISLLISLILLAVGGMTWLYFCTTQGSIWGMQGRERGKWPLFHCSSCILKIHHSICEKNKMDADTLWCSLVPINVSATELSCVRVTLVLDSNYKRQCPTGSTAVLSVIWVAVTSWLCLTCLMHVIVREHINVAPNWTVYIWSIQEKRVIMYVYAVVKGSRIQTVPSISLSGLRVFSLVCSVRCSRIVCWHVCVFVQPRFSSSTECIYRTTPSNPNHSKVACTDTQAICFPTMFSVAVKAVLWNGKQRRKTVWVLFFFFTL